MAPGPVYFWREFVTDYESYLSQWYLCSFEFEGRTFNCTEQWMMWSKAVLFGDEETAKKVLATKSQEEQRNLGRGVKNFDSAKWDAHKSTIVERGNHHKFNQSLTAPNDINNPSPNTPIPLKKLLLDTGTRELVEASPHDRIWGIGFSAEDAPGVDRKEWGQNLLGKALMRVRERLREGEGVRREGVSEL